MFLVVDRAPQLTGLVFPLGGRLLIICETYDRRCYADEGLGIFASTHLIEQTWELVDQGQYVNPDDGFLDSE